jgi:hypothetical protein
MATEETTYQRERVETAELTHVSGNGVAEVPLLPVRHKRRDDVMPGVADSARTKPGTTSHLFLPSRLRRRVKFLIWLRRTHAWTGLWGAALALLFGSTGILLNHRAIMKIPAAKLEQTVVQLPLPEPRPADAQALARWLQGELKVAKPPTLVKVEPAQKVIWNDETVQQPELWRIFFASPQQAIDAEYWVGNAFVTVKRQDPNVFALLTRLHKGTGVNAAWVLLVDTLAGGLIVLALSGILLWSRLHGTRLFAAALGLGSLSLMLWFAWYSF